jgi:hypothetical protein
VNSAPSSFLSIWAQNLTVSTCSFILITDMLANRIVLKLGRLYASHSPKSAASRGFCVAAKPKVTGSSPVPDDLDDSPVAVEQKLKATTNYREKIKLLWKRYGMMFVATYLSVYGATLTGIFATLDFGLLNASSIGLEQAAVVAKVSNMIESATGIKWLPNYFRENPRVATLAVAWVATKFTEPLRLGVTVMITPTVAKTLRGDKYS